MTHKMSGEPEYMVWKKMKGRCYNENDPKYQSYGGRGIRICDEWKNDFVKFYENIGIKPGKEYSIDRVNNDGNYEPGNCRWATPKEQARNRRSSVYFEYNDNKMLLIDISKAVGIKYDVLYQRIFKYNWSPNRAFSTKVRSVL